MSQLHQRLSLHGMLLLLLLPPPPTWRAGLALNNHKAGGTLREGGQAVGALQVLFQPHHPEVGLLQGHGSPVLALACVALQRNLQG